MSKDDKTPAQKRTEDREQREAYIFTLCAGALMVAAITFGLLNSLNVIHV